MYHLALGTLVFLIAVAALSIWWIWAETGDVLDEVAEEWEPIETLRSL